MDVTDILAVISASGKELRSLEQTIVASQALMQRLVDKIKETDSEFDLQAFANATSRDPHVN